MKARAKVPDFADEAAAIHKHIAAGEQEFRLAARELMSVRGRLQHGHWMPWLKANGFAYSTVAQLLREYAKPEKGEKRRANDRARKSMGSHSFGNNVVKFPADAGEDSGDDDETIWRRGLLNRADEAVQLAAYEEGWRDRPIDQALVDAAEQAAGAWKELAAFLRRNRK